MSLFAICSTLFMFTKLSSSFRVEMELESLDSGRVSDFEWFLKPGVSNQVGKSPGKDMKDLFPGVTTITITLVNRVYSVNTKQKL